MLLLAAGDVGLVNRTLDRVRRYVAADLKVLTTYCRGAQHIALTARVEGLHNVHTVARREELTDIQTASSSTEGDANPSLRPPLSTTSHPCHRHRVAFDQPAMAPSPNNNAETSVWDQMDAACA